MKNNATPQEKKQTIYERIFYNNKLMLVLSFVIAISINSWCRCSFEKFLFLRFEFAIHKLLLKLDS